MTDSNNRLLSTLVAMQLLTLGILIVMLFNSPSQNSGAGINYKQPEKPLARENPTVSPAYSEQVFDELKTELREIIRTELAALPASTNPGVMDNYTSPEAVLTESELQEQETATAISTSVVQQAAAAGIWTRSDTEALLPHLGKLSEQQRLALMDQLYGAINRQEMDIQDFPPL